MQHRGYVYGYRHGYLLLLLFAWPATFKNLVISKSLQLVASVTSTAFFFLSFMAQSKICSQILAYISSKIALYILLCWPTIPKINVGDMLVEVAASWQGSHCYWYRLNGILAKCTFILSSLLLLSFLEQQQQKTDTIWSNFIFTFTSICQIELNFNQTVDDITKTFEHYKHMITRYNTLLRVFGKNGWENGRSQQILIDGCLIWATSCKLDFIWKPNEIWNWLSSRVSSRLF